AIAAKGGQRADGLATEIAGASRSDAELSHTIFQPVHILALVTALAEARRQSGVNGGCTLTVSHVGPEPWLLLGDASRLERVLENLLDNAVSFSPAGGTITVALEHDEQRIAITVCDEGPGIPSDAREHVFERFHSLRPAEEDF